MAIRTPNEAKNLFKEAMALDKKDFRILTILGKKGSTIPVKLAAKLLISPDVAHKKLSRLKNRGLVINTQLEKQEIYAKDGEEYFILSEKGEEMITILPLLEEE